MAKKKPSAPAPKLSPAKYIRQKARDLPVYECLVNDGWEEGQLANVVVARQHTNGNITAGLFLVDLLCIGVKDTTWFFNISMLKYQEMIDNFMETSEGVDTIDYNLAHNIIYAGIEFAADYEFEPHKDFTSITQYILYEDSDNIPLIEIDCGMEGLPAYMQGPLHSKAEANRVIAQLERVAGPGNYYLLDEDGNSMGNSNEDEDVDNWDESDGDERGDPFSHMSLEEKKEEFTKYFKRLNPKEQDDLERVILLAESLIFDLSYGGTYQNYIEAYNQDLSVIKVDDTEVPDEMIGVGPGGISLPEEVKMQFDDILNSHSEDFKKKLRKFKKNKGVEAAVAFLEIILLEEENPDTYEFTLKATAEKYPNWSLIKLRCAEYEINGPTDYEKFNYEYFFSDRETIHPFESLNFLHLHTLCVLIENDIDKSEAWKNALMHTFTDKMDLTALYGEILIFQIQQLANSLNINIENIKG